MNENASNEPPHWMLERLSNWCAQWALDQALKEEISPDVKHGEMTAVTEFPELRDARRAQAGEVMLVAPVASVDARPLYLAVLPFEGGTLLCVPFSPFSEPATPGELLTHYEADALRVLCFWAGRVLSPSSAPAGWQLDAIDSATAKQWQTVQKAMCRTGLAPPGLRKKCGVPLSHPADPRRAYIRMMRDLVNHHLGLANAANTLHYPQAESDQLKAAEDPDPFDE